IPGIHLALSPFMSGVLGLGIHFSTYIGEVYRSGIESVEKGQWEAARALNFHTRKKWTKIILPQALPPTIPMLGNYLIILFKEGLLNNRNFHEYKGFAPLFVEIKCKAH